MMQGVIKIAMDRLPFTDENLEVEAYKDKCDELSELEAQNNHTSWGRWFMDDGMLKTWVVLPERQNLPVETCRTFDIAIERCIGKTQRDFILEQLSTTNWCGSQGLHDLKRAFKYLTKKSKSGRITVGNEEVNG